MQDARAAAISLQSASSKNGAENKKRIIKLSSTRGHVVLNANHGLEELPRDSSKNCRNWYHSNHSHFGKCIQRRRRRSPGAKRYWTIGQQSSEERILPGIKNARQKLVNPRGRLVNTGGQLATHCLVLTKKLQKGFSRTNSVELPTYFSGGACAQTFMHVSGYYDLR